jgi:hypothetical protein|tara:strand:- start:44 stop:427 length:384 start_codon:yes stop_codon:yes gene_type:complete
MAKRKIKKIRTLFLIICILQLFHIFFFRSEFQYEVIKNPFKKDYGISFVVSPEIIETINILKKHEVKDFNLSASVKNNIYLFNKTIELNYPIRMNENSKMIFFLNKENVPNNCEVIEAGKYFKFTQC